MGGVSLSSSPSPQTKSRERKKETDDIKEVNVVTEKFRMIIKGWQANAGWKPGPLSTGGSQRGQRSRGT